MKHSELLEEIEYLESSVSNLRKKLENAPVISERGQRDRDKEYRIIEVMVKNMDLYSKKTFLALKLGYNNFTEAANTLGIKKFDELCKERFG
jgi:hypothetical protein